MRRIGVLTAIGLVLIFYSSAAAFDIQKGIHGMRWASSVSAYTDLVKVKALGSASYYANSRMIYESANQPVPAVYYGFYQNRFFAVFIKLRSPNQLLHLERQFTKKYGAPKSTRNPSGLTVHRWRDQNVTIKLKSREAPAEYKMAIYYLPLASWFNQNQLEKAAPDSPPSGPSASDSASSPAPLIE
jgi:hypothetical protein